jgi:hypothetical protein
MSAATEVMQANCPNCQPPEAMSVVMAAEQADHKHFQLLGVRTAAIMEEPGD